MGSIRLTVRLLCRRACAAGLLCIGLLAAGCSGPSQANIELRKENSELLSRIERLEKQREADHATIRSLRERQGALPTLPQERLEKLVTVGGIKITKLTTGFDFGRPGGADSGVKVYVRLLDAGGEVIKAAGSFTVEVFDLADRERPLVAKKEFPVEKAEGFWYPMALVYSYVLPVEWADGQPPRHEELTVKVTYIDELTQRMFTEQAVVRVKLSTTRPTTGRPRA